MAQQTSDIDGSTDPELLATTAAEAVDSLVVLMGRDEMREACRSWGLEGYSGPKRHMAETMMAQAPQQAVGYLAEEGVALEGELAEADEAEDEQDDTSPPGSLAGDLLARSPEAYGYTAKLQCSEKQVAALKAALEDPEATQDEVAEAADCTTRYANSVLNRWRGTEDEVEALEAEGVEVPSEYTEVDA